MFNFLFQISDPYFNFSVLFDFFFNIFNVYDVGKFLVRSLSISNFSSNTNFSVSKRETPSGSISDSNSRMSSKVSFL